AAEYILAGDLQADFLMYGENERDAHAQTWGRQPCRRNRILAGFLFRSRRSQQESWLAARMGGPTSAVKWQFFTWMWAHQASPPPLARLLVTAIGRERSGSARSMSSATPLSNVCGG